MIDNIIFKFIHNDIILTDNNYVEVCSMLYDASVIDYVNKTNKNSCTYNIINHHLVLHYDDIDNQYCNYIIQDGISTVATLVNNVPTPFKLYWIQTLAMKDKHLQKYFREQVLDKNITKLTPKLVSDMLELPLEPLVREMLLHITRQS